MIASGDCIVQVIMASEFAHIPHDKAYWSQIWGPARNLIPVCVRRQGVGGVVLRNGI